MNEEETENWEKKCRKEVASQIILNRLEKLKKISPIQKKEIQKKINKLGYANLLSSPHLEGKEELRKKAAILCLKSYSSLIGITK